jgi:TrmH family RNA methyltransferase
LTNRDHTAPSLPTRVDLIRPQGCSSPKYNECLFFNAQPDRLSVVLVSPRNPLNIGAAARAMANFGSSRLTVVAPFEAHWREAKSAVGAPEVLRAATECQSLADAIASYTLVIGTGTLAHRKAEQPVVRLPELAPVLTAEIERGGRAAIVFGPEKHGLTRDALSRCHLLVEIPTDTRQPSMNLGQAVAVCLYELSRLSSGTGDNGAIASEMAPLADSGTLDRLAELIERTMHAAGYSPAVMHTANRHDLHLLLRRLRFDVSDAKRTLGVFRRILWRLEHPRHGRI